ncbi:MAG: hypothetical protein M3Z31_11130 [Pseudomonadota bacterium]|nr:hypothetical protein [Pseudomonadota bacterium]
MRRATVLDSRGSGFVSHTRLAVELQEHGAALLTVAAGDLLALKVRYYS